MTNLSLHHSIAPRWERIVARGRVLAPYPHTNPAPASTEPGTPVPRVAAVVWQARVIHRAWPTMAQGRLQDR